MASFHPPPSLLPSYSILIFFFFFVAICHCYHPPPPLFYYEKCAPLPCGNSILKFPFVPSDVCGDSLFQASCENNRTYLTAFSYLATPFKYRVVGDVTESSYNYRTITIADDSLSGCDPLDDLSYPSLEELWQEIGGMCNISDEYTFGTFLNCTHRPEVVSLPQVTCMDCGITNNICFFFDGRVALANCSSYTIVVPKNYNITAEKKLRQFLQRGFQITWTETQRIRCQSCESTSGRCGLSPDYSYYRQFVCFCPDDIHETNCSDGQIIAWNSDDNSPGIAVIAAVCACASASLIISAITIIISVRIKKRRLSRKREQDLRLYVDRLDSTPPNVENFLQGYSSAMPTRYSYTQIKRCTNNFVDKLGQGGFGTVFKGKLPNGCEVAVKILDKSTQSGRQFMTEVATVGRIHHFNLVRLLGYCFKDSKRALVYEYMANGSLEKYIHGSGQHVLDWKQLYTIAIGTARGIAYLHEECTSRILHCDIKPHNILLDATFSPKVSDFGLAKLLETTHISMTGARGTPGYAAPEMWSRNSGPVTDRSDVYSFGMLVMEMVGARKNLDMGVSTSSQFYFPEWAFKQVEKNEFGTLIKGENLTAEDENIAKKLSLVGLWCIQHNASYRPPMTKVIQMLEGSTEIATPPPPFPVDTPKPPICDESSSTDAMIEMVHATEKGVGSLSK